MKKTATTLILVGMIFAYVSINALGIDLLIDAVGFLLIWNGLSALHKLNPVFAAPKGSSLALVVISSVELFTGGWLLLAVTVLKLVVEAVFCIVLARSFIAYYGGQQVSQWNALGFASAALLCMGLITTLLPIAGVVSFVLISLGHGLIFLMSLRFYALKP